MEFKKGVKIFGVTPEIVMATLVIQIAYQEINVSLVGTSVVDGVHSNTSLHYSGNAIDLRTRTVPKDLRKPLADTIRERLTDEFDVILESDHIHVEFQPKTC